MSFNEDDFKSAQAAAQGKAREGWKGSGAKDVTIYNEIFKKIGPSQFVGYDSLTQKGTIQGILKDGNEVKKLNAGEVEAVLDAPDRST